MTNNSGKGMQVLFKGIVHPWLCDAMGHLNTRHYMAMFDDASYHMLSEASDWDLSSEAWKNKGWADVSHQIDYKNELHAGTLVEVTGGIREIGRSSFTSFYSLRNKMTGVEAATMLAKVVFFDLQARKSMPITDRMREQMKTLLLETTAG